MPRLKNTTKQVVHLTYPPGTKTEQISTRVTDHDDHGVPRQRFEVRDVPSSETWGPLEERSPEDERFCEGDAYKAALASGTLKIVQ